MLVVATIAFGEAVRLFFFNFNYQLERGELRIGPHGGEGFRQIRYFPEHGWSTLDVMLFIWAVVVAGDGGAVVDGPLARRRGAARGRRGRARRADRAASTSPP